MRTRYWLAIVGMVAISLTFVAAGPSGTKEPVGDEGVLVKVYSVADLVAPIRVKPGSTTRSSLAEWPAGLQSDAEDQLARLENVLRLALPRERWEENNGPGAIAIYPEKLSLIIRQTDAGHRAVEDLLNELRKGDDFEIELQVEVAGFDLMNDDEALKQIQKLGHPLSAEELADMREQVRSEYTALVHVGNGRTVVGCGLFQSMMPRFTAVAAPDRTSIELRLDNASDDIHEGKFPWTTQTQAIPVGKTTGMLVTCDGGAKAYLITPRIVPRRN